MFTRVASIRHARAALKLAAKRITPAQRSMASKKAWQKRGASGRKAFGQFMSKLKRGQISSSAEADLAHDVGDEVIARWDDKKRRGPVPIEPVIETGRVPLDLAYQGLLGSKTRKSWIKFVAEAVVADVEDREVLFEYVQATRLPIRLEPLREDICRALENPHAMWDIIR